MLLLTSFQVVGQLNLPNTVYYNQWIDQLGIEDSLRSYFQTHTSFKPVNDQKTNPQQIFAISKDRQSWFSRKLFNEHFLTFEGRDYWVAIDPVVDLEAGVDRGNGATKNLFWNTRGIRIQAKFFENFGIETKVYENQAILLDYQEDYVDRHGEFVPVLNNTIYKQQNGMVPGYSRTKPFGDNGYDFAFAEGYLSYSPADWVNVQLGNGNQFIGQGHRSLLLSDFTGNYPFLKPELFAFKGRLQYTMTFAALQNLYRLPFHSTPEANFERNRGTFHYLEYALTKQLQIGIFEGTVWKKLDSAQAYSATPLFFNPVIGSNSLINQTSDLGYNAIFGVNAVYSFAQGIAYGQLVVDQSTISGYQAGLKWYNLLVKNLNFRIEYNQVDPNSYLSGDKRLNYGHSNLPLAHPYGAGFKEGILQLNYSLNSFFVSNHFVYSERVQSDSLNVGVSILLPESGHLIDPNVNVVLNQFELGYRFNKNYNLQLYLGYLYRREISAQSQRETDYIYFGVRTKIKNKTLDW